jgi:hypothetical protein
VTAYLSEEDFIANIIAADHPKNPGGKLHWGFDVDNIPYQYDHKHPRVTESQGPARNGTVPDSCDTWDMPELERRGWTTTQ